MAKIKGFIGEIGDFFDFLNTSSLWGYIKSILQKVSKVFLNKKDQKIIDTLVAEEVE